MQITLAEYKKAVGPQNKYFARRTEVDGIWFDSAKEAKRYRELLILERCGEIANLRLQPEFPLTVSNVKIGTYRGDFAYLNMKTGEVVIEDCKGVRTQMYRWKKKHFEAQYGRKILET